MVSKGQLSVCFSKVARKKEIQDSGGCDGTLTGRYRYTRLRPWPLLLPRFDTMFFQSSREKSSNLIFSKKKGLNEFIGDFWGTWNKAVCPRHTVRSLILELLGF